MQFSLGCEYAIHGLLYLALQPPDEVVLVTDIAKAQNLPVSYLAKVFQYLAKAGLVKSFRGAKGGYMLAKPPDKITLRHVTQAIDGAGPMFSPLSSRRECSAEADCLIREAFSKAEESMLHELEKVTLQEMVERARHMRSRMKWLHLPEGDLVSP